MDTFLARIWRSSRYNQHLNRALADRYHKRELWAAVIVALVGPPMVIAVFASSGPPAYVAAALVGGVVVTTGLLMRWSSRHSACADAVIAWRGVEHLCEDEDRPGATAAAAAAIRLPTGSIPGRPSGLEEAARRQAERENPEELPPPPEPRPGTPP